MASPQTEDGFTKIANELLDALIAYRIPGEQRQCLDVIMRQTYGYRKKRDAIALSQFVENTGIVKPHVVRALNALAEKNLITVTKNGNKSIKIYEINKDFDKWKPLPKKGTLPKKVKNVTKKGNKSLPNLGTTKEKKERKIPTHFFEFSKKFHTYQKEQLGKSVEVSEHKIQSGAKTIDELVRIDGFDFEAEIKPALAWAVKDSFWYNQILSLASLRKKRPGGEMKFRNLYAAFQRANKKTTKQNNLVY